MRIFITGATGFMGKKLGKTLSLAGHDVTGIGSQNADLTNPSALARWDTQKFDRIYHLAAWTQAGDFCLRHPGEQWIINQKINTHVLDWWQRMQPQAKLVCMGTSCSYATDAPLTEDRYLSGQPIESLFSYAYTKRMLYVGLKALAAQYGMRYLCVVPSTLYGPEYHTDGRQLHFIFDLIRKILRGKQLGEPVILWGDGYQRRELVLLDDFIAQMLMVDARCNNELVNIGSGEEFTIRDFADIICAEADYDASLIQYDTSRYVGASSKCLDIEKLRTLLPGYHATPLAAGLSSTIAWFKQYALNRI